MPGYYRSRPPRPPAEPAPRRRPRARRFGGPSLPLLLPPKRQRTPKATRAGGHPPAARVGPWLRRLRTGHPWHGSHLAALFLVFVAAGGLVYAFAALEFYVYDAEVEGARYTAAAEVYREAGIEGYSIFFVHAGEVARRLESLPYVHRVRVHTALPNRVRIVVTEREPVLLYEDGAGRHWVDAEGVLMPVIPGHGVELTLVDETTAAPITGTDGRRRLATGLLQAVLTIHRRAPSVTHFRYRPSYGLAFTSPEGWQVYLGDTAAMETKLATWEAVRARLLAENAQVHEVDLRFPQVIRR
ncbi:MAG: FtsQ-type POTRA domain-containing protein [Caldilineales bacterium]|nr:FtsQ-type POTRA domain-containing protein [Caldilineales bacterium]